MFWVRRNFVFFRFFFFERARPAASMRPPCLISLSTRTGSTTSGETTHTIHSINQVNYNKKTGYTLAPLQLLCPHIMRSVCSTRLLWLPRTYTYIIVYSVQRTPTSGNLPLEVSIKDNVHKRKDTKLDFLYIQTSGKYVFKCSSYVNIYVSYCDMCIL